MILESLEKKLAETQAALEQTLANYNVLLGRRETLQYYINEIKLNGEKEKAANTAELEAA